MPKIEISITTAIVALVIIAIALTFTTFAAVTTSQNVQSSGAITSSANLGVYSNSACTTLLSNINWGTLIPGGATTQTIYLKNTGSDLSLALSMATNEWTPAGANGPITLTWNKEGAILQPGQSVAATFTLSASSSITNVTSFSVQITLTGTN